MGSPDGSLASVAEVEGAAVLRHLEATGRFRLRALHLGQRLATRDVALPRIATGPEVVLAGDEALAVLFRYGAVVFFYTGAAPDPAVLEALQALAVEPFEAPESEDAEVRLAPAEHERASDGVVLLRTLSVERLQVVADVMAKTVVLAQYESVLQEAFDRIEPLAERIGRGHPARRHLAPILRNIGATLVAETKLVGRVRVTEKPDLVWDHPPLDRLWGRMAEEYELGARQAALERQLELIGRTSQTALGLLQAKRSLRVEQYIVLLIVVEILLTLYELFLR